MKTHSCTLVLVLFLTLNAYCFEANMMKKHPPAGSSAVGMDTPISLYGDHIKGQTVEINYSKCIDSTAKRIQFMIFFNIGDCTNGHVEAFVKVSNSLDFHYNKINGNHESTYWNSYSQSFIFPVESSNKVILQVQRSFGGVNHGLGLYCTGYFSY